MATIRALQNELQALDDNAPIDTRIAIIDKALAAYIEPTKLRGQMLCVRGFLLIEAERYGEARESLLRCRQLLPQDPQVLGSLLWLAENDNRPVDAAELLIELAGLGRGAPDDFGSGQLRGVMRRLQYADQMDVAQRLSEAMVNAGWYREEPQLFSSLIEDVMRARLEDGDVAGAVALLPDIIDADIGAAMLIDRRYERIWPQIEAWAGEDMSAQRAALVGAAKAAFDANPTGERRLAYLGALIDTGQRAKGMAAMESWLATPYDAAEGFERALAYSQLGGMFAQDGRIDAMVALMRRGLSEVEAEWQLNLAPNYAVQLILAGQYAEADALLDRYSPADGDLEDPAANGYFIALQSCVAEGTGNKKLADAFEARALTDYAGNSAAMSILTACRANDDRLAADWIGRLDDPTRRQAALMAIEMARHALRLRRPPSSLQAKALTRILGRKDLAAAYLRYGRQMPTRYLAVLDNFRSSPR